MISARLGSTPRPRLRPRSEILPFVLLRGGEKKSRVSARRGRSGTSKRGSGDRNNRCFIPPSLPLLLPTLPSICCPPHPPCPSSPYVRSPLFNPNPPCLSLPPARLTCSVFSPSLSPFFLSRLPPPGLLLPRRLQQPLPPTRAGAAGRAGGSPAGVAHRPTGRPHPRRSPHPPRSTQSSSCMHKR